jgi:tripartite-type tricarboxylate transporter receptor subunit TctC
MPIRYCPRALLIVLGLALGALPTPAAAQDPVADFYRGKQVSILVGFTPGGSSSLYAQALARHMGRYLPGSPSFIVQHVPGAGGLLLANNVANTAPRDGTAFAITGRTAAIEPLLGNKNAKFDGRHFNWLGTANVETRPAACGTPPRPRPCRTPCASRPWSAVPAPTPPR